MLIVLLNKSICIEKTLYISLCFKCLGFITKSYGLLSVDSTVYVVSMEIFILHISLCNIILFAPLQIPIEQNRYAMACASCRIAFFVFYTKNSGK